MQKRIRNILLCTLASCWCDSVFAQSTIFNYQGRLAVDGAPANGFYDFVFTIYKIPTNGVIIAGPMTNAAVPVNSGLFNIALDFGNQPFLGVNRFMDISVRTNGTGPFSPLIPRLRIASAPYAIAAANVIDGAVNASALSPGPGAEGQVLQMSNGVLTWGNPSGGGGGGVSSIATGTGLLGGPITNSGTLLIDQTVVPLLANNQTYISSNTFNGVVIAGNTRNRIVGSFFGSGAGLTNVASSATNGFGQFWTGEATDGLFVQNTEDTSNPANAGASGVTGYSSAAQGLNYGVFGQTASTEGIGVEGFAFASHGFSTGVYGESTSTLGTGVYGIASATTGKGVGIYGESDSTNGIGVYGVGISTSSVPIGVYGESFSPTGFGLFTPDRLYVGSGAIIAGGLAAGALFSSGANLTNLNASTLSTGTVPDARLSGNVHLLNSNSTQTAGRLTFAPGTKLLIDAGTAAAPGLGFANSNSVGLFSPAAGILAISTAGSERVRVAADGKLGIGRTPLANNLEVEGTASKTASGNWLANSDARIKTGVQTVEHALDTIEQVRPVSFYYTDQYRAAHPSVEDKRYYNVIAQEFAKVFPEAVKESGEVLDGKPILQVDTYPATIFAIGAIQELHALVKAKDAELSRLKEQNVALENRLQALEKLVRGH